MTNNLNIEPDIKISVNQTFGFESDMEIDAFSKKNEYVPEIDKNYKFDKDTTLAILSGFSFNKRLIVFLTSHQMKYFRKLKKQRGLKRSAWAYKCQI